MQANDQPAEADKTPVNPAHTQDKRRLWILGAGVAAALVVMLAIYVLLFANRIPHGPKFLIGKLPYAYSCQAFESDLVAQQLGIDADKSKMSVDATYAYAPDSKSNKEIDLVALTGSSRFADNCDIEFNITAEKKDNRLTYNSTSVSAEVAHYKDDKAASDAQKQRKQTSGATKSLPSFKDASYYTQRKSKTGLQNKDAEVITSFIHHKHMILSVTAAIPDKVSADAFVAKIDSLVKVAIQRIDGGTASTPKDFTNQSQFGGKSFVDACYGINFAKVSTILGNVELRPTNVSPAHKLVPYVAVDEDKEGMPKSIQSDCAFAFRTAEDKAASKDFKVQQVDAEDSEQTDPKAIKFADFFPHTVGVAVKTFENAEAAKQYANKSVDKTREQLADEDFRKQLNLPADAAKIEEVKNLGDYAARVSLTLKPTDEQKAEIEDFKQQIADFEAQLKSRPATPEETENANRILANAKQQLDQLEIQLGTSEGASYYIVKGQRVYLLRIGVTHREKPFKTTDHNYSEEDFRKLFSVVLENTQ